MGVWVSRPHQHSHTPYSHTKMKLPLEWIKEYVETGASAEEIVDRLTMAGLEVEETEASEIGPVLNIKVTPNRGDCLSVIGVARELAAALRLLMKPMPRQMSVAEGDVSGRASVRIED